MVAEIFNLNLLLNMESGLSNSFYTTFYYLFKLCTQILCFGKFYTFNV